MEAEEFEFRRGKLSLSVKFDEPTVLEKDRDGRNWWTIRMFLDGDEGFIQRNINKVVYHTHPTFPPNLREITTTDSQAKFSLTIKVWGRFVIRAMVYLRNGEIIELSEPLPPLRT